MKMQSPCIDCRERTAGCHSRCFKYVLYRAALRQYKKKVSQYWHQHGFDPAEKERRRKLKAMWMKTK
jgi:hypothetical protein